MHTETEAQTKQIVDFTQTKQARGAFNYSKLQAYLCMAASAAISISLIIRAIKAFG